MNSVRTTVVEVEGMTCGNCVRHVAEALRALPGVTAVEVRLQEGRAVVHHDAGSAPVAALVAALAAEGYPAREASPG